MIQKKQLVRGQQVISHGSANPVVAYYAMPIPFVRNFTDRGEVISTPISTVRGSRTSSTTGLPNRRPILNWLACRPLNSNDEDIKMSKFLESIRRNDVDEVKRMIEEGMDPNLPNYNANGEIPIIEATYAGSTDVIRYLLSNKVNVNMRNLMGESAIHIAAQPNYFNPEILKLYLDYMESDLNVQDRTNGYTPLHILTKNCAFDKYPEPIRNQSLTLIRYLLPDCDVNKRNFKGETAIHLCVDGNLENVTLLEELIAGKVDLDVRNDKGETALIAAINKGFLTFAEILIRAGTNLDMSDLNRQTPLHRATQKNYVHIVELLLKHKCDVNLVDHMGDTALHIAAGRGFLEIVKMILATPGVEPKRLNHHKFTPYHCAMESGFPQVVHTLLVTKYLPTAGNKDRLHEIPEEAPMEDDVSVISVSTNRSTGTYSKYSPPPPSNQYNKYSSNKNFVGGKGEHKS